MTRRAAGLIFVWCALGLIGVGVVTFLLQLSYEPDYDRSGTDFARYSEVFARLRDGVQQRQDAIDFAELNDGDWKTLCAFGGYTDPLARMHEAGAKIDDSDTAYWTEAGSRGFRLAPVEEFEIAIAYVDSENRAHFLHFEEGIGASGQHLQKCISKPETRIVLPLG